MIIGTMRPEEAKVFSGSAGYHKLADGSSVEVFWVDAPSGRASDLDDEDLDPTEPELRAGWYWQACLPGCLPDGEPNGPFGTSHRALGDAEPDDEGEEDER